MTDSDTANCPACGKPSEYGRCQMGGCPCEGLRVASAEAQATARRHHQRQAAEQARTVRILPPPDPWWLSGPSYGSREETRSAWENTSPPQPLTGAQALIRLSAQSWNAMIDEFELEHEGGGLVDAGRAMLLDALRRMPFLCEDCGTRFIEITDSGPGRVHHQDSCPVLRGNARCRRACDDMIRARLTAFGRFVADYGDDPVHQGAR